MKSYDVTIQRKPPQEYFHMVPFFSVQFLLLRLWMKSYGVTIQTSWAVLSPGTIKPYFDF